MISAILILLPLITGAVSFAIRSSDAARRLSFFSALITLGVAIGALLPSNASILALDLPWLPVMGSRFALSMDGMSKMLCLLTALSFPVIFLASFRQSFRMPGAFYGWMLLSQAGLMGVFLAADALLFYFFWELALIPVYFLCSTWGGERRIAVTIKFFLYTFIGSLLMLAGIIYLSFQMPTTSFAISDITKAAISSSNSSLLFVLFFIAFAIKMPVFPLHTWQPDAYEESPSPVTMVMSGVMVKMGIYAVIRWLLPLFPSVAEQYASIIIAFAVAGMLYASLIA
ncbi:MAG: NADH-quinone oxidoreductase subunit M, partial [Chitinophagaceae bacterium]|nr:NADH-quinone oxidoreductase subunit M [Chitinophagaceae bacterium]